MGLWGELSPPHLIISNPGDTSRFYSDNSGGFFLLLLFFNFAFVLIWFAASSYRANVGACWPVEEYLRQSVRINGKIKRQDKNLHTGTFSVNTEVPNPFYFCSYIQLRNRQHGHKLLYLKVAQVKGTIKLLPCFQRAWQNILFVLFQPRGWQKQVYPFDPSHQDGVTRVSTS